VRITYSFSAGIDVATQERVKEAVAAAFEKGEIVTCKCSAVDAWVYETTPPDFQASISCSCDAMRPLYSSTPDTED
jgi:hypothetical protein